MEKVLYRFYIAGYNGKPRPKLANLRPGQERLAARKAHIEGLEFRRQEERFLKRMA